MIHLPNTLTLPESDATTWPKGYEFGIFWNLEGRLYFVTFFNERDQAFLIASEIDILHARERNKKFDVRKQCWKEPHRRCRCLYGLSGHGPVGKKHD